jgi:hypothetical protein
MKTVGKTTEYDPSFSANANGIAFCPKCNKELTEADDKKAENWWYCTDCEHWIITQPSHHEHSFLGYDSLLMLVGEYHERKLLEFPGGYLKPYCPRCTEAMWVEKMWWDRTDISGDQDKIRLVLGYVCQDWKNCGYTQTIKVLTHLRFYDYLKELECEEINH